MAEVIIGAGSGGKGGSGGGLNESADNLKSKSYAQIIDLISEGEIVGLVDGAKSIYLDDTPLQNADGTFNFSGVSWAATTGTQDQPAISGSDSVRNEIGVAVEAKAGAPVVRSINNLNVTSLVLTVQFPQLTFMDSKGNLGGTSVSYAIDLQNNGGGWQEVVSQTVTGKSSSSYERQHRIQLPTGGPWDFRLRRITADSTSSQLNNKTFLKSYTEVIDVKLRYPNSALVALRVDASQFRSVPRRAYKVRLLKIRIPTNATVQTDGSLIYSGSWDGTFKIAWCRCPAWAFYDAMTASRYGLGRFIPASQIDKWALYKISKYCNAQVPNGFGGTEPRFTCNLFVDTPQEAYKFVNDMASIFRAMPYWAAGTVTLAQDAPGDPEFLFHNGNVEDGLFTYQGSSAKARHTVALVAWNDPEDMCRTKVEYVEDTAGIARYGVIETQVIAVGCTSRGQANRVGRWLLYSERFETDLVSFKTATEGATVAPGKLIKLADQHRAGKRIGGRVLSADYNAVVVDALAQAPALPATLYVVLPDGSVVSRAIQSINGNIISLSSRLDDIPLAGAAWSVGSAALEPKNYRIVSSVETDGVYEIAALEHEPGKFDLIEQGIQLEKRNYTSLSPMPSPVASVAMGESLYRQQNAVRSKVTASWAAPSGASAYRVRWRENNGAWREELTSANDFEILDTKVAVYDVEVTAIGVFGTPARAAATASISALGKTAPPSDVTGLTAQIDARIGITLNWAGIADLDLDRYEVRAGVSWDSGSVIAQVASTSMKVGAVAGVNQTFWIKAIDTTGIYSVNASSCVATINAPTAPSSPTATVIDNNVLMRWSASSGTLAIDGYEIRRGANFATATVVGVVKATFMPLFETQSGQYTYWIVAVDIAGNYGLPVSVVATVAQPPDYTLLLNAQSTFGGTKSNAVVDSGSLYLPVPSGETWENHFTSRGWSTPQDQVNAGHTLYAQPAPASGYYEEVIDYGTVVPACKITVTPNMVTQSGTPALAYAISVSNTSASGPWTDYSGTEAYSTAFRWVKVRITVTGGQTAISSLMIKLDAKQKDDAGQVYANAADASGTLVTFTQQFIDVSAITVSPQGSTLAFAVYDFVDVPNPTSFRVYLYNQSGARISGTVSWAAKGY